MRAPRRGDIPEVLPADDDDEEAYKPRDEEADGPRSEEERASRRKKKLVRKKLPEKRGFFSGFDFAFERSLAGKGTLAGVLIMVIAVVWFVCGLYMNWIFYYPPVLFIVGLIAFIKGLTS